MKLEPNGIYLISEVMAAHDEGAKITDISIEDAVKKAEEVGCAAIYVESPEGLLYVVYVVGEETDKKTPLILLKIKIFGFVRVACAYIRPLRSIKRALRLLFRGDWLSKLTL